MTQILIQSGLADKGKVFTSLIEKSRDTSKSRCCFIRGLKWCYRILPFPSSCFCFSPRWLYSQNSHIVLRWRSSSISTNPKTKRKVLSAGDTTQPWIHSQYNNMKRDGGGGGEGFSPKEIQDTTIKARKRRCWWPKNSGHSLHIFTSV